MTKRLRGVLTRHPRILLGLLAAYWLAMLLATHVPMPQVESAPQNTDKVVHLVMYAGFAFLLALWLTSRSVPARRLTWIVLGLAMLYAAVDELLQIPIESRSGDVWDFVMDLLGACLGLLLFAAVRTKLGWLWETNEQPV